MKIFKIILTALFLLSTSFAKPHDTWDTLLSKYVNNGLVDYSGLKSNTEDLKALDTYLDQLGKASLNEYSREQKLAFWINAYNAFTVKLILNNYPVKSIKDIENPWDQKSWRAAGEIISLNDMEHKKLRAQLKEPRIHFAIVCASTGCPNIDNKAFNKETVEQHLTQRAQLFFTLKKNFNLTIKEGKATIYLSSILKWFSDDFGKNQDEKLNFIIKFLNKSEVDKIQSAKKVKVKYMDYDWSLNGK